MNKHSKEAVAAVAALKLAGISREHHGDAWALTIDSEFAALRASHAELLKAAKHLYEMSKYIDSRCEQCLAASKAISKAEKLL